MHFFKSLFYQFVGLWDRPPFSRFFKIPLRESARNIAALRKEKKFRQMGEIVRASKPYRRYSLRLAREIALAEGAARLWPESAESWQAVCRFPVGVKRNDWLRLVKVQQTAGFCDDAIRTLRRMKTRFPGDDVTAALCRLRKQKAAYKKVDQEVLACEPGAYKITYFKNKEPSSTVAITFGIIYSDFHTTPFGFPFITKQGFDHIHVAQERYTFYQLLDLDVFLGAVAEVCRGKKVVAYGSSLGAYAAFYFGGPLGAKILAASPRNSVDECITKISKHWAHVKWLHGKIADHKTSPEKPVVFWDPLADKRDDVYLRQRIFPAYPDLDLIGIPGGGHSTFQALRDKDLLKDVFCDVVSGEFSAERIREQIAGLSSPEGERTADVPGFSQKPLSGETKPFPEGILSTEQ